MKLKTLKEIAANKMTGEGKRTFLLQSNYDKETDMWSLPIRLVSENRLKHEAIEWIKDMADNPKEDGTDWDTDVQHWIKHFFNIEASDLK